jgi:hypothetical protein
MTRQQFIEQLKELSVADRIAVLEAITRSLRDELEAGGGPAPSAGPVSAAEEAEHKVALVRRLYGILRFEGPPPTDEELQDVYANYLAEKYS